MNDVENLRKIVNQFDRAYVLVIGDMMLDRFIKGSVNRISPEAPVPVVNFISEIFKLGGAANAINNIRALGGTVFAVGFVGADENGRKLEDLFQKEGINTDGIIVADERITTVKTRVIAEQQQIVRIDKENRNFIHTQYTRQIFDYVREKIYDIDAILISDYDKGFITRKLLKEIIPLAKKNEKPIIVDPKDVNFLNYTGATVITPNLKEASFAARIHPTDGEDINDIGRFLLKRLECNAILITRGKDGMSLYEKNGDILNIPTAAKEVFDVTGAGDTVAGVVSLALAVGAQMKEAAMIANAAAGIVVGKLGTATETKDELKNQLNELTLR